MKLTGKLATYCESSEHGSRQSDAVIREEIIPDLLFHAAQLGNALGVNADRAHADRLFKLAAQQDG